MNHARARVARAVLLTCAASAPFVMACGERGASAIRVEVDATYMGYSLRPDAWSQDGRAFALKARSGGLAVGRVASLDLPPRLVVRQRVKDHVWSPNGDRLACRVGKRKTLIGLVPYDVLVVERDSIVTTVARDQDVWALVWLSDTSLWARKGPDGALCRLASFRPDSVRHARFALARPAAANAILPTIPPWRQLPTLLVGPSAGMPAQAEPVAGAPGFAQLELSLPGDLHRTASSPVTRQFLGWIYGNGVKEVVLDSVGRIHRVLPAASGQRFDYRSFGLDGTVILGVEPDYSQGGRATRMLTVAADGGGPVSRVKGPLAWDVQGAPRGDRVLVSTLKSVIVGRLVTRHRRRRTRAAGANGGRLLRRAPDR